MTRPPLRLLMLLASAIIAVSHTVPPTPETIIQAKLAGIEKMRLGKDSFGAVEKLHQAWYAHSVKALLVQVSKQLLPTLTEEAERHFLLCLNKIKDKLDIVSSSKCMIAAKESLERMQISNEISTDSAETAAAFIQEHEEATDQLSGPMTTALATVPAKDNQKAIISKKKNVGAFRRQRKYRRRHHPKWSKNRMLIYEQLFRLNKISSSEDSKRRVKRSEYRLIMKGSKPKSMYRIKSMKEAPALLMDSPSTMQAFSKGILNIVRGDSSTPKPWAETYKSLLRMKKSLDDVAHGEGARVYDLPMSALVFVNKTAEKDLRMSGGFETGPGMPPLMRQAFHLANTIKAHTSKTGAEANFKFLSPRFAPVMPDKLEGRGLLSPSFLAFYKDDTEQQIAPIPKLLEATGMSRRDRESMLEMIMEVSGAREVVDKAYKMLSDLNLYGMEGDILDATKRISKVFNELEQTFNPIQRMHIKKNGYAFLDKDQLRDLYKKQGIDEETHVDFDLDEYGQLKHHEREKSLWLRIEQFAANRTEQGDPMHRRRKRQGIPPPSILSPTVLSPYMFKPILGLSVLGPTVLSPSIFSPLILNPAVLSPYVISPAVFMPFILSPYLLSPYVLSPIVGAPFILNPYVLSPNVINPYILSPLILSPLVLCPDVLSPMSLGGAILSPGVASPNIMSKSTLMASVLSPSFLS